ncbi:MAG: hypothetical protein OXH37_02155, partial [Gammaproteobacteria bacterium]|nr:hypothetical protein [Gammaproteobacteria bacterium]
SRGKRALQIREFGLRSAISTKRFAAWATRVIMRVIGRGRHVFEKSRTRIGKKWDSIYDLQQKQESNPVYDL